MEIYNKTMMAMADNRRIANCGMATGREVLPLLPPCGLHFDRPTLRDWDGSKCDDMRPSNTRGWTEMNSLGLDSTGAAIRVRYGQDHYGRRTGRE